ncbi:hypothetical protein M407DRAFT_214051 [Tulasnella calospora MUT 4182]|uniref:LYR motif-containing protein 2 n=1 Tax=Tulasnella calospora MUT 4182 TaxID=1051891 RepID=A0A0C3KQW8_9AGAM|nr:hypothetical protein M407DRAFT_214051 [Tulasnella calospora MUT 4182]
MLTFQHFLLKGQVYSLYRSAIRGSRGIPDPQARKETLNWIRSEIEQHRSENDIEKIKSLIGHGKRSLKQYFPGTQL